MLTRTVLAEGAGMRMDSLGDRLEPQHAAQAAGSWFGQGP